MTPKVVELMRLVELAEGSSPVWTVGLGRVDCQFLLVEQKVVAVETVPSGLLARKSLGRFRSNATARGVANGSGQGDDGQHDEHTDGQS